MICICKDPLALGVVHRSDAPCYIPEQRLWVGLTVEEIKNTYFTTRADFVDYARAIEAKLKEKNT